MSYPNLSAEPVFESGFIEVSGEKLKLIITGLPVVDDKHCVDYLVHILRGSQIQGEMRLTLIEARTASANGVLWDLLSESSVFAHADELVHLVEPVAPSQLLLLEHFARESSCTLPARALTKAVGLFFKDAVAQMKLGIHSAALVTYPFPLEMFDEEAAAQVARLYEQEWGMEAVVPAGMLRYLALSELAEISPARGVFEAPVHQGYFYSEKPLAKPHSGETLSVKERTVLEHRFPQLVDKPVPSYHLFEC